MAPAERFQFRFDDGRVAHVHMTDRRHGDLAVGQPADVVGPRRREIVDAPWTWLDQVHGATVLAVAAPGEGAGHRADASWTTTTGAVLSIQVADCAPVALLAPTGAIGLAHAGWRGLELGVIEATAHVMATAGHRPTAAVLGACITGAHYEFGCADLDRLAKRLGDGIRGRTATGAPALSMPDAVAAALQRVDIGDLTQLGGCTASDAATRWSHRARRDVQRQALVGWIGQPDDGANAS